MKYIHNPVDKERPIFPNEAQLPYRSTCVTVQLLPTQCATRYRSARVGGTRTRRKTVTAP